MRILHPLVLLLAACAPETELLDPAAPVEVAAPPVTAAPIAGPTLRIAVSEAGLAGPAITTASIATTDDIYVRLTYPLAPPPGEARLDVVLPTGAVLVSVEGQARGHDIDFVIPVGGAPIGKRGLGGEYSLVVRLGGESVAGAVLTLTEGTP